MRSLARAYDRLIMALAILAGAMLAGVFVMIVYDVTVRTLGYQPPFFTSALSEYAMLYMTLLAAPWVVRVRGHVYVESVTSMLRERTRHVIQKGVYVLCLVICPHWIAAAQSIQWAQIKKKAPENYDALRAKFPPSPVK